ncbi:MFS transporter [Corynebacterium macginleyi]|uniref:MFS transporter n=1 Tax=Corynebacterium macginleyi TaxID=38290 RepID=UPI00190A29EB|nr:MFS transporter [Corynebacterium macginleyi]MBK4149821.1 MFS transporter [Corynebacterium macginleyi]MBK4163383.1 MFS transporter [Corynebacterium macginleyi]MBK4168687.1 MFS transporter [Corynebacterium macginleyi]MBK4174946.1 MFS transporter [Corynebacterium macginleyi]QRJ57609.1 MFS transporter [Corynebacterium macginleyi]
MRNESADTATQSPHHAAAAFASTPAQRWSFFAVVSLGLLLVGLDNSILYTALPQLTQQLHATDMQQLWIINAYTLVLSGLLLGTGTLGDRIGHRLMFLIGLATFGTASLLAAYSPNAWFLISGRALLGFGAAIMLPSTLALIRLTFPNEVDRNKAIGIWSSVAVVGAAAGPTVGGFLLEHFWWGSVFLINVPIVALTIILTFVLGPPNQANPHKHWDFLSSFSALITLSSLVLAIKTAAASHTNAAVLVGSIVTCLLSAAAFGYRQRRLDDPLLTCDIFSSPTFSGGVLTAGGAMFAITGLELLTTQKLQLVDALSPLNAGLFISAMAVAAIPTAIVGGTVLHRVGFLPLISGGFLSMDIGMLSIMWADRADNLAVFITGLILTGVGAGSSMSVSSTAIINAAPSHRAGMASGVEAVSYEFGTLLSIAITGSLVPLLMTHTLPDALAPHGTEALLSPSTHETAAAAYDCAYFLTVGGLACIAFIFAVLTAWCFRNNPKSGTLPAQSSE